MSSIIPPIIFVASLVLLNTLLQQQLVMHPRNPLDNSSLASHHWSLSLLVDLRSLLIRDIVPMFPLSSMVHLDKAGISFSDPLMFVSLRSEERRVGKECRSRSRRGRDRQ